MSGGDRIVLRQTEKPLIEEIRKATGVGSNSDAVALLVRRYGQAFLDWFLSDPHQCLYQPEKAPSRPTPPVETSLTPLSEVNCYESLSTVD